MGKERLCLSVGLALIAVLAACATPRIVVLEDPLSAQEHVDLGLSYELQGRMDLAEREYRKAADKEPDWAIPHFNLGNVAYLNRDLAAAERFYARALDLDKTNPDIMNNLANVLHEQGRSTRARELIEQALEIRHRDEYLDTLRRIDGCPEKEESGP